MTEVKKTPHERLLSVEEYFRTLPERVRVAIIFYFNSRAEGAADPSEVRSVLTTMREHLGSFREIAKLRRLMLRRTDHSDSDEIGD